MVNFDKVQQINKLAKALKDTKLADTNDKAMKMAEQMINEEEENISELQKKEGEEKVEGAMEKVKTMFKKK